MLRIQQQRLGVFDPALGQIPARRQVGRLLEAFPEMLRTQADVLGYIFHLERFGEILGDEVPGVVDSDRFLGAVVVPAVRLAQQRLQDFQMRAPRCCR